MRKENINNVKGKAYYQSLRSKYLNFAKEAAASGDRVLSEYNLQYAEHYGRIISERFSPQIQPKQDQKIEKVEEKQVESSDAQNEPAIARERPVVRKKKLIKNQESPKVKETVS